MSVNSMAPAIIGRNSRRSGWILSGLVVAFLLIDAVMKLMVLPIVVETGRSLGFQNPESARTLGVILLVSTLLYVFPRTSILGAILLTGYLGGAIATHVRVENPLFTHVLFGAYLGLMLWAGLYLRDARLRTLIPLRT